MSCPPPSAMRCALVAAGPTSPLCGSRWSVVWPVAAAGYRPSQKHQADARCLGQRGHARRAALCTRALCATGGPPDITALWCSSRCCSVSGPGFARARRHNAGAWLWPAARSCRARCLLFRRRCALQGQRTQHHRFSSARSRWLSSVATAGYRPGQAAPGCRIVPVASGVHARYGHTLRFYITPHFAKCSPVAALKLRLVSPTAARPHGFAKQALCKVAFAWVRARQPSALPGRWRALRAAARSPWWLPWQQGIGQALRAWF